MDAGGAAQLLAQCKALNEQRLFPSAAQLASFLINANQHDPDAFATLGTALLGTGEHKRALGAFQAALDLLGAAPDAPDAVELRCRIAECYAKENNYAAQLSALAEIPAHARPAEVHMALGRLLHRMGNEREAVESYKAAMVAAPLAVEAVGALARLGVPDQDIIALTGAEAQGQGWVSALVAAQARKARGDFGPAKTTLTQLAASFPESPEVLARLAACQAEMGQLEEALRCYARVRSVDVHYLDGMDWYASALMQAKDVPALNKLTYSMLDTDVRRPEGWVAGSMYMELKKDRERAMEYAEKALALDPRHEAALLRAGHLHMADEKLDLALVAFRKALEVSKSISAFQGAVKTYVAQGRIKEALSLAKEALERSNRNPKAFLLVGMALSQLPEGLEKAQVALEQAVRLDPHNSETVMELVNVLVQHDKLPECVEALSAHLRLRNSDEVHSRLGDIYAKMQKLDLALGEYNTALALNRNLESARVGLDRLEKTMKGIDPDGDGEMADLGEADGDANASL